MAGGTTRRRFVNNLTHHGVRCFVFVEFLIQNATDLFSILLTISSSCNNSVIIRLVATRRLQTASLWIIFDNQLATSLLTTCNRLVVNKLSVACYKISTDLLQLARFGDLIDLVLQFEEFSPGTPVCIPFKNQHTGRPRQ